MTDGGPGRLRATDGTTHRVVGVLLFLLCPVVVLVVGLAGASRNPGPFAAAAAAHAVAAGYLLWLVSAWLRPTRRPRPADLALVVVPVVTSGASLWLLLAVAQAYGIRGSALPRVRQGIPFPTDIAYLAAVGGAVATLVAAAVLLVALLPARRVGTARPPRPAGLGAGERVLRWLESAPRDPLPAATSAADGWLTRILPPRPLLLLAVPAVAAPAGLVAVLLGDVTVGAVGATLALLAPAAVTAWTVLRSTWRPDADLGVVMAALWRTMGAPFVTAAVGVPGALVVALLPGSGDRFGSNRAWSDSLGGILPSDDTSVLAWVLLSALVALMAALLAGLVLSVGVVLPLTALLRPEQVVRDNVLSTAPEDRAANVLAVRALGLLLPLLGVAVVLLVGADGGSLRQVVGIVVAAAAAALTWLVRSRQRTTRDAPPSDR